MANSQNSGSNYEYATVDTYTSAGYFTIAVDARHVYKLGAKLFFSIREALANVSEAPSDTSTVTVALQFLCPGDADWTDYVPLDGSSFAVGNRIQIDDNAAGVLWRAGVRSDEYTSGSVTFGFDW